VRQRLARSEVTGFKPGPVKRHGCPSHGIGLTPNEREVWVVDAANEHVHIFDNTATPPKQMQSIKLREQPGWITFSIDGNYAYPSTGQVISTKTKQIVSLLTDETGREVHSEKMLEVHKLGQEAREFGDQFGVGRVAVKYQRRANGETQAATAVALPMMYTPQCYSGSLVENIQPEQLISDAIAELDVCLLDPTVQQSEHAKQQLVKLNFVTATENLAALVPGIVQKAYGSDRSPPISVVVGSLPEDAAVGVDAIAVYDHYVDSVLTQRREASLGMAKIAPRGPRVYISGQAEKGSTPAEAAANTISSLKRTLDWLGCDSKDALQAKCFLTPMSAAKAVRTEFDKAFGENQLPLVFVEWKSDLPIEIELIAQAPPAKADVPPIEFLTPPGMKASPIYSRVVRVNRGNWTYTSGLSNKSPKADEQVLGIFEDLSQVLKSTGGDFEHLVKATYYVSNEQTSKSLNELRPRFYQPSSAPSASKAMVASCGNPEQGIVIDMIAIPRE
jgi:enamine deaminase RidA (YjgF/YER057c/UK114 family)